ncbi:MAG: hypothetical protein O7D33_01270, partial [Chloroflexi bacterium]|nr:hypothetical protein [Chloroflexota bacterium]
MDIADKRRFVQVTYIDTAPTEVNLDMRIVWLRVDIQHLTPGPKGAVDIPKGVADALEGYS